MQKKKKWLNILLAVTAFLAIGLIGFGAFHLFQEQQEVDKMILFDHIIHNTDRHERNFGVIRNPDTLEITGFAPLFDSGSSFGWNYSPELHDMGETKPFRGSRMDQLKLLKSMNTPIPDEQTVKNILQETYEWFGLPEQNFQIAETDVRNSYRLLLK